MRRFIRVLVAVAIYSNAANADRHQQSWLGLLFLFLFVISLIAFEELSISIEHRRRMPYRWECPRCKVKTGMESSREDVVQSFREEHNRRVHLQEP